MLVLVIINDLQMVLNTVIHSGDDPLVVHLCRVV